MSTTPCICIVERHVGLDYAIVKFVSFFFDKGICIFFKRKMCHWINI